MTKVFVVIAGQHDNLGDVVLHRGLLKAVRPLGPLHVVTSTHDEAYMRGIVHGDAGDTYLAADAWAAALDEAARRGPVLYFQKPGELILSWRRLRDDLLNSRLLRRIAKGGGASFILGVGARSSLTFLRKCALRMAYAPYALVGWRDARTAREAGVGEGMPDWAFGYGTSGAEQGDAPRDTLVVSLRVDRPAPSEEWIAALRRFADGRGLAVVAVCQVARDMPLCEELARKLGGTVGPWIEGDFAATEAALRTLYRRTAIAVSDRLHVLIIAATEGAVPLCLLDRKEDKIARHFEAIGYTGAAEVIAGPDVAARVARLEHHAGRRAELVAACDKARDAIRALEARLAALAGA